MLAQLLSLTARLFIRHHKSERPEEEGYNMQMSHSDAQWMENKDKVASREALLSGRMCGWSAWNRTAQH